jgi:hypothetical protein
MSFPGTAHAKRGHVPPPPSGTLPDPGGASAAERDHRLHQQAADLYTRWKNSFPPGISADELQDSAGLFAYSDPALALPDSVAAVQAEADAADKRVGDLMKSQTVPADVGAQLAADRYWRRQKQVLDSISDGSKVAAAVQDLINSADDAQIPTLAEELSSYLSARSLPTGWLTQALSARIPNMADAQADQVIKARQLAIAKSNHRRLMDVFSKGTLPAPVLHDPTSVSADPYEGGEYRSSGGR